MTYLSLSWDTYRHNICSGLSLLQQNGEFVDMTIAADGHHVKVHQMVMSLCSPYIKDLISSAQCTHPIIFLNKVSYSTLSSILEYIYTGETLVEKDNILEFVEAAKELNIKGLNDMKLQLSTQDTISQALLAKKDSQPMSEVAYLNSSELVEDEEENVTVKRSKRMTQDITFENADSNLSDGMEFDATVTDHEDEANIDLSKLDKRNYGDTRIQYTLSTQGSLQMILNRFIYYLRYTSRCKKGQEGHRQWRCLNYINHTNGRCPAIVVTKDDIVVKRHSAHNHPFHDQQILKKVKNHAIYSALNEAEMLALSKKKGKSKPRKNISNDTDMTDAE